MLYNSKNPHGGDIYGDPVRLDFSANTNPFGTPEGIIRAVQESLLQMHRYPDPYCRRLVTAIGAYEQVPKSSILCGNGAADLIYAYCEALRPRKAVELAPTFSEYSLALRRVGCRVEHYLLPESNDFRLDAGFLDFLRAEKPDAAFLCNPNNPSGALADPGLMEQIVVLCREEKIRLFVDECFLDLTLEGRSLKPLLPDNPHLFLLKAFTKSYGMAGIRLGYCLCADEDLLSRMSAAVQPWNVSSLAQAAGIAALQEQEFLQKTRLVIAEQRQWLREQLEELGFRVCPSQTNFLLFYGPEDLHRKLKEQGIAIRNCDNYQGLGPGWYRIAVRLYPENQALTEAISRITERKSHG